MRMGMCSRSATYFLLSQMVCFGCFLNVFFVGDNLILLLMNPQDVVMEYCYGHSQHLLENDDLNSKNHNAYFHIGKAAALLRHMYWIFQLMQSLPNWLAVLISPSLGLILELRQVWAFSFLFTEYLSKALHYFRKLRMRSFKSKRSLTQPIRLGHTPLFSTKSLKVNFQSLTKLSVTSVTHL